MFDKYANKIKKEFGIEVQFTPEMFIRMRPRARRALTEKLYVSLTVLRDDIGLGSMVNPSGNLRIFLAMPPEKNLVGRFYDHSNDIYLYYPRFNSLAHELFHAIDCQAGRMFGVPGDNLLSDFLYVNFLYGSEEEKRAANNMCRKISSSSMNDVSSLLGPLMEQSRRYDEHVLKARYESIPGEVLARAFEAYVEAFNGDELLLFNRNEIRWMYEPEFVTENYLYPKNHVFPFLCSAIVQSAKELDIRTPYPGFRGFMPGMYRTFRQNSREFYSTKGLSDEWERML